MKITYRISRKALKCGDTTGVIIEGERKSCFSKATIEAFTVLLQEIAESSTEERDGQEDR